ncbi:hypothetical protein VTO73DRAFT_6590 [Trametes versicolor]
MLRCDEVSALEEADIGVPSPNCLVNVISNEESNGKPLPQLGFKTVFDMVMGYGDRMKDMEPFWEGYRSHFASLGINLCSMRKGGVWAVPQWEAAASAQHPFASCCTHDALDGPALYDLSSRTLPRRMVYAQDTRRRDLVIKLTDKGSMEYKIYRHLAESNSLYDSRDAPGVLPPTAVLDSPYQFAFVVMPMWGIKVRPQEFETLREVMTFIRHTLSGLSYLHRHRIAHRDIDKTNMMVNRYCARFETEACAERLREHCRSPFVAYALFDFDLSIQLPPETPLDSCRRPAEEALQGQQLLQPPDIYQGERHYNPFAFDVACLGRLYLAWFKDCIPVVPLLAPMLGKMTTHIFEERWTAEDALAFFNEILAGLSPAALDSSVVCQYDYDTLDNPDIYWNQLTPELQLKWKAYRPSPRSWTRRVLRWLISTDVGCAIVPRVRLWLRI